jgi:hypothetical protein
MIIDYINFDSLNKGLGYFTLSKLNYFKKLLNN